MINDNSAKIEKAVLATLPRDRRPTEEDVLTLASSFRQTFSVRDEEFDRLLHALHAKFAITMDMGTALVDQRYVPWLSSRKASIDPFYWDRFMVSLNRASWPPLVLNTLDRITDEILDLTSDPQRPGTWARRGLVVGDVQSGKTTTYTALCCKAADAGFRLIILLTGTIEALRRQTQERLDEGFVGLDSSEILQRGGIRNNRLVGVGHIDSRRTAGVFTSKSRDFNRNLLNQLGFRLDAFQEPVLVVIKKNKRILENLHTWLSDYNAGDDDTIGTPMLIIDDEADSASINTNAADADPTAINNQIRELLKLFRRATYVGFTATPFANVFIDPNTDKAMLDEDLFPRDFIYSLEAPDNYIGPRAIFEDPSPPLIQTINDADAYFPSTQRSTSDVAGLPPSLLEAVNSFLIANAVRDLRGQAETHRSMLVNVSRFTNVQNQVAAMLDATLRDLQRQVRNFASLSPSVALQQSAQLSALHNLWRREFDDGLWNWEKVQYALNDAVQPVVVRSVNQSAGGLDYSAHRQSGLRVIAVGGNSLSRGLTLEGLSTSYFFRNSQMYDTLMQMGRWFGYRDGYLDLCRLWITDEAADWYSHIMEATEELRAEFKRMRALSLTPRDFGLKVRAHPDSLIVTARNKMRTAQTIVRNVSLSGQGPEASRLWVTPTIAESNRRAIENFTRRVGEEGSSTSDFTPHLFWRDISKDAVAELLGNFQGHPMNFDFQMDMISSFLSRTRERVLELWDVAIPSGNQEPEMFAGLLVKPIRRVLKETSDRRTVLVSGSKKRVGSGGIERLGLTDHQRADARTHAAESQHEVTDADYRSIRPKPLILLYIIRGYTRSVEKGGPDIPYRAERPPLVSVGLSFPRFDDSSVASRVEYRVNTIEMQSMMPDETDDDVLDDDRDGD
jgi:hypothetical protein